MKVVRIIPVFWLCFFVCTGLACAGQKPGDIALPPAQTEGGKPLMQALKLRSTSRYLSPREIPLQVLSNLLWAAFGVNRPATNGRTAPSAQNMQEIDMYVARADGLYLYNAKDNVLEQVLAEDIRAFTGQQKFVAQAPLNLVYVADYARMGKVREKDFYAAADTGFISQNVYLFCASEGLATVVRGWFEPEKLKNAMKLRPEQKVILTQSVGYPQ